MRGGRLWQLAKLLGAVLILLIWHEKHQAGGAHAPRSKTDTPCGYAVESAVGERQML